MQKAMYDVCAGIFYTTIPVILETACLLAALIRPNHLAD